MRRRTFLSIAALAAPLPAARAQAGIGQAAPAFARRGVLLLRADWTNRNDEITRELGRFNRNGVPLYVLYDRSGATHVLPELLTERIVLDALGRLGPELSATESR